MRIGSPGWQDLLDILRTVDPVGVREAPVYIVHGDELPAGHRMHARFAEVLAFNGVAIDLELRDALESAGRWIGRGAAIVIGYRYSFAISAAITLHEWAHEVDRRVRLTSPLARLLMTAERETWPADLVTVYDSAIQETQSRLQSAPQIDVHGAGWLRAVIHLRHRAEHLAMMPLPIDMVAGTAYYDSVELASFMDALGDEPERRVDESLQSILATDPPAKFAAMFAHRNARQPLPLERAAMPVTAVTQNGKVPDWRHPCPRCRAPGTAAAARPSTYSTPRRFFACRGFALSADDCSDAAEYRAAISANQDSNHFFGCGWSWSTEESGPADWENRKALFVADLASAGEHTKEKNNGHA
jgi:hypothetical protein